MASKTYKGKQVMAYVTRAQKDAIDAHRKTLGISQAELIRQALEAFVPDFPDDMPAQGNPGKTEAQ